jgi:hypothetical protein
MRFHVASAVRGGNAGANRFDPGLLGKAGVANASSSATTVNGSTAVALSTASGSGGQAQATAQTNFIVSSVQGSATSQVGGIGPAISLTQAGSGTSTTSAFTAGQSFSVVSG